MTAQAAVPHRIQLVGLVHHELAGGHVGVGRELGERETEDDGGAGEQVVIPGMGVFRQLHSTTEGMRSLEILDLTGGSSSPPPGR